MIYAEENVQQVSDIETCFRLGCESRSFGAPKKFFPNKTV